ncbi:CotH kinase family protein [Pseudobacillus wudalianchiensis]|uniref:Spore coat protein n=1 Tax=Pseudobacillus wudalianchiensis TaxID=1743143 RepID=A0A1B9AG77_9BACI|nr:CotH kinase family protein [Bacillus wudalianchiensis]OCA82844.1 spore coat protein [Bacillus wudalianchiensis]
MSYPIPSYFLMLEEEDLDELQSDIWNDDPVPAYMVIKNDLCDIDIAYRGSYTREFRKRSYQIDFIDPETYLGARQIHLNAEYRDPSLIRNKLSFDFFQELGVLSPGSQHINLIKNGSLKGVYLQLESVDDLFLEKRGLPLGPIYYAVNNDANFSLSRDGKKKKCLLSGYERIVGNESDDAFLRKLIRKINTTPLADFPDEIPQYINIEKYFYWLAGAVCTMNNDGFTHNYALYRNSETGLYEIIPWDYDATWGRRVDGGVMEYDFVPIKGKKSSKLCYLLLKVPKFRKLYQSILEEILETKFTVDHLESKVMSLYQALRPHVLLDPYKKSTVEEFDGEPEFIFQFIRDRNDYLKKSLKNLN